MSKKRSSQHLSKYILNKFCDNGLTTREIAVKLNTNSIKVRRYIRRYNLTLNRRHKTHKVKAKKENPTYFRRYRLINKIARHLKSNSLVVGPKINIKEYGRNFIPDIYLPDQKAIINFIDKRKGAIQNTDQVILRLWEGKNLPKLGYNVITISFDVAIIKAKHIIDIGEEILILLETTPSNHKLEIDDDFFGTFE